MSVRMDSIAPGNVGTRAITLHVGSESPHGNVDEWHNQEREDGMKTVHHRSGDHRRVVHLPASVRRVYGGGDNQRSQDLERARQKNERQEQVSSR